MNLKTWLAAGLVLWGSVSSAATDLCPGLYRRAKLKVPQLVSVSGDRNALQFRLQTWERGANDSAVMEDGARALSRRIGEAVAAYGKNNLKAETNEEELRAFTAGVTLLVFETLNNAAFHGNQSDTAKQIFVSVRNEGEKVIIEITDQSGKFYDIGKDTDVPTAAQVGNSYINPDHGGGLGKFIRENYKERFKIKLRSEPARGTGGATTGTRVFLEMEPRVSLAPKPE